MSILQGIAALNVYKQVALVRTSTDALTFEDDEGNLQTITDLGEAASSSVSSGRVFVRCVVWSSAYVSMVGVAV